MTDVQPSGPLGVITTQDLLRTGLESREITRLVRRRELVRLRRGAYVPGDRFDDASPVELHRLHAAALMTTLDDAVVSHVTAAAVHGLPLVGVDLEELHVTRPGRSGAGRVDAGVRHHVCALTADDRTSVEGVVVTGLERTAFDVARSCSRRAALVVADAVLARGADRDRLLGLRAELEDWPGSRRARAVLPLADGRSESAGESLARLASTDVGMAPDLLQVEVETDLGRFRADLGWSGPRVLGEFDGRVKYGRALRGDQPVEDVLLAERQRELALERAGWHVVRFTWAEVHDLGLVRRRLGQALRRSRAG